MARATGVLYLLHDSRRSGVPAVAVNAINALIGTEVTPQALFAYDGVYAEELRARGVRVATMGPRRPFIWRLNRFMLNARLLGYRGSVDVVHIHSIKLAWSVLAAKAMGFKVVYHLHELPRRIGWLLRTALAAADCAVFCSESCAAHFAAVPARARRTMVNAMHFADLPPVEHDPANHRIVMVGSINRNKGQDLLLKAFTLLQERRAELWFYGTTGLSAHKYVHALKKFAADQGVAERVFFPGPTDDVFRVFSRAAVVVHTSLTESFGMALVEAQSCGVPVIAHDLEGMREVVVDGVSGFLVEPGNIRLLAERLDTLLADPEQRAGMGGAAYRMVRERFSVESRRSDYLDLYREVCRQ
jgi:glycosyltransferase involved in cell wall biosynthesis